MQLKLNSHADPDRGSIIAMPVAYGTHKGKLQQQQKQYKNLNYARERQRKREGELVGKQAVRGKQERLADT